MALPELANDWKLRTVSVAMTGLAALSSYAEPVYAQNTQPTPVAYAQPTVTEELRQQEAQESLAAILAAGSFAEQCETCVGVVFSKGDDFRSTVYNQSVAFLNGKGAPLTDNNMSIVSARVEELLLKDQAEEIAALFKPMGVKAEVHAYTDYAPEGKYTRSGASFHVGQVVYEDAQGESAFLLNEIDANLALDIVEDLSYMWKNDPELVTSQLNNVTFTPQTGG